MSPNKRKRKIFRGPHIKPERERHAVHPDAKPYKSPVAPKGKLRIIPLGGLEEVGRNCIVFEYERDIVIIDMGLQFAEDDMPGVDYSIPNMSYLRGKEKNIRGIIITHGHYDHIGGLPHIIGKLGNPPIYSSDLTLAMIAKKQEDVNPGRKLRLNKITTRDTVRLGAFTARFIGLSHNIPAALGVVLKTPVGTLLHTGDFKIDPEAEAINKTEIHRIKEMRGQNLLALLSDSTNAAKTGRAPTEKEIERTLDSIFQEAKGRMLIATFASLISRSQQIIRLAEKHNRKIMVEGYSLKTNVEISKQLGYIKANNSSFVTWEQAKHLPPKRLLIMCTGAQGEDRAVLMRIANREHKYLKIEKDDLIVFSSSVVPGNETSVQRLKDGLYREGADVIDTQMLDVHAGGHARADDLAWFIRQVRPRYFIPIEGNHSFLHIHGKLAIKEGVPADHVFIADNGQVIEFTKQGGRLTDERVPVDHVFVDGLGVGDISHVVLRDRQQLAADGMVLVITTVEARTGRLLGNPDIITRGFISIKSSPQLIDELRRAVKRAMIDREPRTQPDQNYLQNKVRNELERAIFNKTQRQPMILTVIIKV